MQHDSSPRIPNGIGDFATLPSSCTCPRRNWAEPSASASGCRPCSTWRMFGPTGWPSSWWGPTCLSASPWSRWGGAAAVTPHDSSPRSSGSAHPTIGALPPNVKARHARAVGVEAKGPYDSHRALGRAHSEQRSETRSHGCRLIAPPVGIGRTRAECASTAVATRWPGGPVRRDLHRLLHQDLHRRGRPTPRREQPILRDAPRPPDQHQHPGLPPRQQQGPNRNHRRWQGSEPCAWGGARGIRTPDLFHAMEARYQLRHSPSIWAPPCRATRTTVCSPGPLGQIPHACTTSPRQIPHPRFQPSNSQPGARRDRLSTP